MKFFYVYEHWRPDTDLPFYVGKGKGGRSRQFRRNAYYNSVVAKLASLGLCVEVRVVAGGLEESQAFEIEMERIAFWRKSGIRLTNLTDGGEGSSGRRPSEETRTKMSIKGRGRKLSLETRAKMSTAAKNRSPEYWAKISAALSGKPLSKDHCAKLSAAQKGRPPITEETRAKLIEAQRQRGPRSDETRARTSASIKAWHAKRKILIAVQ